MLKIYTPNATCIISTYGVVAHSILPFCTPKNALKVYPINAHLCLRCCSKVYCPYVLLFHDMLQMFLWFIQYIHMIDSVKGSSKLQKFIWLFCPSKAQSQVLVLLHQILL